MADSVKATAFAAVDQDAARLAQIGRSIWENPELFYKETFAHKILTDYLEDKGFMVERCYHLDTAFRAVFSSTERKDTDPNIAILCEYDALPGIGHACGHNLIAEIGVAAGMAVKVAMETHKIPGKITVLGTPAEESGGGKIQLIQSGAFKNIDVAMMSHPCNVTMATPVLPGIHCLVARYAGKASHTCTAPWEGVNALDAAVNAYQAMSVLRQQIKQTWRLSAVISDGGEEPSIIPGKAEMKVGYRAPTTSEMKQLGLKVEACLQGAALASGCQLEVEHRTDCYAPMLHNPSLARLYKENCAALGVDVDKDATDRLIFSTDMGDVSLVVPSLHPVYRIAAAPNHTTQFNDASGDDASQMATLNQAKALSGVALDLLLNNNLLTEIWLTYQVGEESDRFGSHKVKGQDHRIHFFKKAVDMFQARLFSPNLLALKYWFPANRGKDLLIWRSKVKFTAPTFCVESF